ncbi:hypothetical protein [Natrinema soli]|uniref:Uncharacterized protein n=1 Tax=Natrinema soli TaxID=1930624 RepID=A0ABD5SHN7_9EURY|nr:hypothetical protein [Natrinema soli]
MTSNTSAERAAQGEQDDLDSETEEDQGGTIDAGEMKFASYFGWIAGYFILSGSIATFIYALPKYIVGGEPSVDFSATVS